MKNTVITILLLLSFGIANAQLGFLDDDEVEQLKSQGMQVVLYEDVETSNVLLHPSNLKFVKRNPI